MDKKAIKEIFYEVIEEMIPEKYRNKRYVRNWEINEFIDGTKFEALSDGSVWLTDVSVLITPEMLSGMNKIKSIKRITDNQIFSLRDRITLSWYKLDNIYYVEQFIIENGKMLIRYDESSKWELSNVRKVID